MNEQILNLAQRIRLELSDLERVISRAAEGWQRAKRSNDDYYVDSVALNLHGFYSGLETLFELIATHIDQQKPTGANWHQLLLQQMSVEIEQVRPAVISVDIGNRLNEYRNFRHVVRNVYTFRFNPLKMESLVVNLNPLFIQIRDELFAFANFLEAKAKI